MRVFLVFTNMHKHLQPYMLTGAKVVDINVKIIFVKKLLLLFFSLLLSFNSYGEWTKLFTDDGTGSNEEETI